MTRGTVLALLAAMAGGAAAGPALQLRVDEAGAARAAHATLLSTGASSHFGECDGGEGAHPWCVRVAVTNEGDEDAVLDTRGTPFEGFVSRSAAFRVRDAATGAEVPYTGMLAKRGGAVAASEDETLTVPRGRAVAVDVDLSSSFEFEAGREYEVRVMAAALGPAGSRLVKASPVAGARSHGFVARETSVAPHLKSAERRRARAAALGRVPPVPQRVPGTLAVVNDGCDATDLDQAITNARAGVSNAYDTYLISDKCSAGDYVTWFGEPQGLRYAEVVLTYKNVKEFFADTAWIADCTNPEGSCSSNKFAYVYPSDSSHRIYLCDVYVRASSSLGFNSQPGTLIHEASHFNDVGATRDSAYSPQTCQDLARTDPAKAVNNGDSMEYFIEDNGGNGPSRDNGCDACLQTDTTCGECTPTAICGFCNSTNTCSRGDLYGSFAHTCDVWFDDEDCIVKDPPSSASSDEEVTIGAATAAVVVVAVIVLFFCRRRSKKRANTVTSG